MNPTESILLSVEGKCRMDISAPATKEDIIKLSKLYPVFHISQVEGVEFLEIISGEYHKNNEPARQDQSVIDSYISRENIVIEYLQNIGRVFYSRNDARIVVPKINQFRSVVDFYSTIFHEIVHSTGYESRLQMFGEDFKNVSFGDKKYSFEELIEEIEAAMLCETIGIETGHVYENNVAYIQR